MDRTIVIDDREVKFRATARTPRLYRMLIMRDMITDMRALSKHYKEIKEKKKDNPEATLTTEDLEIFENVAFIMAKHANPDIPETSPDEWLDTFAIFSIWEILPQILELWQLNNLQTSQPKKN